MSALLFLIERAFKTHKEKCWLLECHGFFSYLAYFDDEIELDVGPEFNLNTKSPSNNRWSVATEFE